MSVAGAARSFAGELLENEATVPAWSVPATVRTWGRAAGTLGRLPFARSFPTAATTSEPVPKAALTMSSSTWLRGTPRLRLITPGPLRMAASSPATTPAVVSPD